MAITIGHGTRVLFTGDSVTDAGRRDGLPSRLPDDVLAHRRGALS